MMWMDLLRGLIASFCERHGIVSVSSCCRFGLQWCTEFWMSRSGLRRFLSCNFPYVVCKFWMRLCRATALNQDLVVWGLVCNYVLNFEYQILGSEGSGLGVAISIFSFQYSWVWLLFVTRHLHVQFCCFEVSHTSTTFALHHSASKRRADSVPVSIACIFLSFYLDANLSNCEITHSSLFIDICVQACLANVGPTFACIKIQICTIGIVKISIAKRRTLRHNKAIVAFTRTVLMLMQHLHLQ